MCIKGSEELEEDEASQCYREGIAMRETFFLGKIVEGAIGSSKVRVVGGGVHQIEVWED